MKAIKKVLNYFTKFEICLWTISVVIITVSFVIFNKTNYLSLISSLIGVTALIFNAKGNPIGPFIMIVFSIIYGIISYSFAYYGELITYVCMSLPMNVYTFICWIRNPFKGNKSQVKISNKLSKKEIIVMILLTVVVTISFYFILRALNTTNLIPSTVSVATSFLAVYLSARRSPYFAFAYGLNDVVLIVLWTLATISDITYISVVICFFIFLFNDGYTFVSWKRMKKMQELNDLEEKYGN